ncbi:MAG: MFS transporter [Tissierellia bacterium]|nr:MFS transporter [Tissierellia bacterium]
MGNKKIGATAVSYFTMFIEGGLNNVVGALMVLLTIRLAREPGDIAILASARGIGTVLTLYASGLISDKKGRKIVIVAGGILYIIFNIGMMTTSSYYMAMIYSFIGGLAFGLMDAPGFSILFDAYGDKSGPYVSMVQVFFGGGGMFTSFLAVLLMSKGLSYNYLFAIYLGITVFTTVLALLIKFPPQASAKTGEDFSLQIFENPPEIKREGVFVLVLSLFFNLANYTFLTWLPLYVQTSKAILPSDAVQSLTYYLLGTVIGSFVFSLVLRRVHFTRLLLFNPFLAIVSLLLLIYTKNLIWIYSCSFFIGFFLANYYSMAVSIGGEFFPTQSGGFTGMLGTAGSIGSTIVASVTGIVVKNFGVMHIMWISIFALTVIVIMGVKFRKIYFGLGKKVFSL